MKYFISISAWNLLESFTTESISPVSFYAERAFGAKLSRFLQNKYDRSYQLLLSTKDKGGDYTIEVDESLIDKSLLVAEKDKSIFSYPKTIYYQKGMVAFRFNSKEIMDSLIAESQILFEVKCIDKYMSDFYVKEVSHAKDKKAVAGNSFSFEYKDYIDLDNDFNFVKGAITGYARGIMTAQSTDTRTLHTKVGELKNAFAGLNTITLMGNEEILDAYRYIHMIEECKNLYMSQREEPTRIFDIMKQQFNEIVKLSVSRASAIRGCKGAVDNEMLNADILDIKKRLFAIEEACNIGVYTAELESIKSLERENGLRIGKERLYFKAGTPEYDRKKFLKNALDDFASSNEEYRRLKDELKQLYAKQNDSSNEVDTLEVAIQAIFTRLSDLSNEIIKKIAATDQRNTLDLSSIDTNVQLCNVNSKYSPVELAYFNTLLKVILDNPMEAPISDNVILGYVEKGTKAFMDLDESETQAGQDIVNCMRGYWLYKNHRAASFDIPANMEIIKSIMGFLLKPFGFDQIEKYLMKKNCMHKEFAFMLWGACIGYADMPKTFTEVLYSEPDEAKKLDKFIRKFIK